MHLPRLIRLAAIALLMIAAQGAHAARPILAPLTELTRLQTHVMLGKALAGAPDGYAVFECEASLSGDNPMTLQVRADADTLATIRPGERYVLAHSNIIKHPKRGEEKFVDPDGHRIIKIRGFSSPALFEATDEVRFLFETARDTHDTEAAREAVLAAIIQQLDRPDTRTRALVIGELLLRPELHGLVKARQARVVGKAMLDDALGEDFRSYLIESSRGFRVDVLGNWYGKALRQVIDNGGVELDLATNRARLLTEAVASLSRVAELRDETRIAKLLRSNSPTVVDSAIAFLHALDPVRAEAQVKSLVEETAFDDSLTPHARRRLEAYLVERATAS